MEIEEVDDASVSDICFLRDKSPRNLTRSSSCQVTINLTDNGKKNWCVQTEAWRRITDGKVGGISFLGEERIGETVGGSNRVSAKMKKQLF